MKTALCLCSVLVLLLVSFSAAQNEQDVRRPPTLLKLFHVGDHVAFDTNADISGYTLTFYSDVEMKSAKDYFANRAANIEKNRELQMELRQTTDPEKLRELMGRVSKVTRLSGYPGTVFAIGEDYIGLTPLDGSHMYIPISKIGKVTRNRSVAAEEVAK